jgi:hypothetical protein
LPSVSHIVLTAGNNPYYMNAAINISSRLKNEGDQVLIADMSKILKSPGNLYSEVLLRILGLPSVSHHLKSEVERKDLPFFTIDSKPEKMSCGDTKPSLPNLDSAVITLARDEAPDKATYQRILDELNNEYVEAYISFSKFLSEREGVQTIHVPNGRFPWQRAVIDVADLVGISVNYYERGFLANRYFHKSFPTQDRTSIVFDFNAWLDVADEEFEIEFAQEWLNQRVIGQQDKNDFSWNWQGSPLKTDFTSLQDTKKKRAVIFTSSEDEFVALGPEWNLHKWENQWQAIELFAKFLVARDFDVSIRIHPNLANKSHAAYLRTLRNAAKISNIDSRITVYRHDSSINSYSLLADSSLVAVWDSTIGLEASALGKKVVCLAPTLYSKAIKTHEMFSEDDFMADVIVDPNHKKNALLFISYLAHRDQTLDPSLSDTWNYAKFGGIRGSLSTWLSADASLRKSLHRGFDVLRHRSLFASYQLISRKLKL